MEMKRSKRFIIGIRALAVILIVLFVASSSVAAAVNEGSGTKKREGSGSKPIWSGYSPLGPLPQEKLNKEEVELGRLLFFDNRYTGTHRIPALPVIRRRKVMAMGSNYRTVTREQRITEIHRRCSMLTGNMSRCGWDRITRVIPRAGRI